MAEQTTTVHIPVSLAYEIDIHVAHLNTEFTPTRSQWVRKALRERIDSDTGETVVSPVVRSDEGAEALEVLAELYVADLLPEEYREQVSALIGNPEAPE